MSLQSLFRDYSIQILLYVTKDWRRLRKEKLNNFGFQQILLQW
jgi:hypothetical protein